MATYASPAGPSVRRVFMAALASAALAGASALAQTPRKIARGLGIALPRSILPCADRIIE